MSVDALSLHVWTLLDLALLLVIGLVTAAVCRCIRQPVVVGELAVGIALGPSLLGAGGGITEKLFPDPVRPTLESIAEVGVVLFVFFATLEMDTRAIRRTGNRTIATALGGTLPSLVVGAAFGFTVLTTADIHTDAPRLAAALFLGVAVSVTAFPVLARVLDERAQRRSPLGTQALATAGLVDLAAWLAITLLIATGSVSGGHPLVTAIGMAGIVLLSRYVVCPLLGWLQRVSRNQEWLTPALVAYALVTAATAAICGTEAILGAVLAGIALPSQVYEQDGGLAVERIGHFASVLVPVFFLVVGLSVDLRAIGVNGWLFFLATLTIAIVTKFGGTYAAARWTGMSRNESALLGALMNMRGLTEVVVVQAGMSAGLLTQTFGTALILVALVTTAMSSPLLNVIPWPSAHLNEGATPVTIGPTTIDSHVRSP